MAADTKPSPETAAQALQANVPTEAQQRDVTKEQNPSRPPRPNYNLIHSKSLPVDVYPVPAFTPHNPISIVRIAVSLLSHFIWPPNSHRTIHKAYFSAETQSVHVTNPYSIRALWEQGFWGKGSLSRSEPQWITREKRKQGLEASKTSAEVTLSRREERRQFKLERAKAQREAVEQQLRKEGKLDAEATVDNMVQDGQFTESPKGTVYTPAAGDVLTVPDNAVADEIKKGLANDSPSWGGVDAVPDGVDDPEDQEHLQLTPEEAFFLSYGLGTLNAWQTLDSLPLPPWRLFSLFCAHSSFPSLAYSNETSTFQRHDKDEDVVLGVQPFSPDNAFVLRYVVYHHFRSLGWVVRPGIKFAVDYLLYLRGPAFSHAEFAVMIIPSYSNPYWSQTPERSEERKRKARKDWWWLHRVNRVQNQVMKTLVLVYVEVPPPWKENQGPDFDIGGVLKNYMIREVILKRWSPARNRD